MQSAHSVAKYILHFFQEAGDPISNLKLQKLLYYAQGWHLAVHKTPLFGERLEAWVHGPVQPGVYGHYKHFRWNPITDEIAPGQLTDGEKAVVDEVLAVFGTDSPYELERRTHSEPPWLAARGTIPMDQESTAVISLDSMTEYFGSLKQ
jgi:uncharacterized phage-associated protein